MHAEVSGPVFRRKRARPRKGQGPDLRQLEKCALSAFSRRGFENVGLRGLAASVGIAPTLILYRYGSKLALWKSLVDDLGERVDEACAAIGSTYALAQPFPDRSSAALRHFVELTIEIPELSPLFIGEMSEPGGRQEYLLDKIWRPFLASILPIIRDAEHFGNSDLGAPEFAAFSILSMIFAAQYMAPVIDLAAEASQSDAVARVLRPIERLLTLDLARPVAAGFQPPVGKCL
ncbi:MAG: hypothetical protein DI555_21275 [Novosphingobium pentaromativorans]|uniref:HTH tetR-type domain-containing protein n=1 Tax=Novosphingobium pentaromativorans TaxID=205844 RepID=A0A2W5NFV5_9SPHN|nr:MAG: hypothetical protein DI555_21275 [Novosphingobium pentaromativorans]